MTDTKNHTSTAPDSLEGRRFRPASPAELAEAVEFAFDYRGDVTVELTSGEPVVGYLFNRDAGNATPWIELFPADDPAPRKIPYADIVSIAFTGEDTANGKSWEAWVSKKESERRAEAAQVEADARTRGHL
ncbi:MAG TPA: hypothetical protein VL261_01685 [Nitrospira sp.]|nr:hypothetical protein [Nitrospira sp.]